MTKSTRKIYMTPEELDSLRDKMGRKWVDLSLELPIKYRTLQDYAAGKRRIPEKFAVKMRDAAAKDKQLMQKIKENIERRLDQQFPNGIRS